MVVLEAKIDGVFLGSVKSLWPDRAPSAIIKKPTTQPVYLTSTGFTGDAQADLRVHGGPEKAVHHYAADHYPYWVDQYGTRPAFRPGGFGENISTLGMTENSVCVGDIFALGEARVQICQGRQPCWKLNRHSGIEQLARQFQATAKTGWYYRVLDEGLVMIS